MLCEWSECNCGYFIKIFFMYIHTKLQRTFLFDTGKDKCLTDNFTIVSEKRLCWKEREMTLTSEAYQSSLD